MSVCRTIFAHLTLLALLSAVALSLSGCAVLQQLIGSQVDYAVCRISGTVVGADGKTPGKLDVRWEPDEILEASTDLVRVTLTGNSFMITSLAIPMGATQVNGVLTIGEMPVPPRPRRYDPVDRPIALPKSQCNMELGTVTLPLD